MSRTRILVVGLGRFGERHLRTWRDLGVEVLGADTDPAALDRARPHLAAAASDYRDLLEDADAVDVVTPAPEHRAAVLAALNAGKDVFCEKPLALKSPAAYELAETAEALGLILQVGHVFRFEPCVAAARRLLRDGRIGRIRYILGHFLGFKRPRADGGVAISDAIHLVDLATWLVEKQPRRVTGTLRDWLGRGLDDAAFITLDYGREVAHIEAGYFPPERKRDLHIMGERGAIVCDFFAPAAKKLRLYAHAHERRDGEWVAPEGEALAIAVSEAEPLRLELEAFLRSIETREQPLVDGYAAAHAVAAIEAAGRSTRESRTVDLELPIPAFAD